MIVALVLVRVLGRKLCEKYCAVFSEIEGSGVTLLWIDSGERKHDVVVENSNSTSVWHTFD